MDLLTSELLHSPELSWQIEMDLRDNKFEFAFESPSLLKLILFFSLF